MITKLSWLAASLFVISGICFVVGEDESSLKFSRVSCDLSINLLKAQLKLNDGNVIFSPSSIGVLLAILQQGARENTLEQLNAVLGMTPDESKMVYKTAIDSLKQEKKNVTLEWGSRAYIKSGFEFDDSFNKTIYDNFGAELEEINFVEPSPEEAARAINDWIKEVTHDNIKNFISASGLTNDTVLVLLNAIFFKGLWDVPFKRKLTSVGMFELEMDNPVEVPFMAQIERFIAGEDPETGIKWVDLPFKDEQFSMLFILPMEAHGLAKVFDKINGELLKKIIYDEQTRQVTMKIPKFKLSKKILLANLLKELGLKDIFGNESNLQGITTNLKNLKVSKILHEANIEIDEDGGTASAATGVLVEVLGFPKASDSLTFVADHPFLFFILDRKNKIPLFAGKMHDPSQN